MNPSGPAETPAKNAETPSGLSSPPVIRPAPGVVVIGASAGGLQAISLILAALPPDFCAPVVLVQHLSPLFASEMAAILRQRTRLHVKEAEAGDPLTRGHVYVAPPGRHVLINPDLTLALSLGEKERNCRPSADVLFRSAAASAGAGAVGVVLTGGDGDGSAGIRAIKRAGGVTLAQDVASSKDASMPRHAAATGDVDFVLPLAEIAPMLLDLVCPGQHGRREGGLAAARQQHLSRLRRRAEETPSSPELLGECLALLAAYSGALGVTEEALRVTGEALRITGGALRVQSRVLAAYLDAEPDAPDSGAGQPDGERQAASPDSSGPPPVLGAE